MGLLTSYMYVSLDGFVADRDGGLEWAPVDREEMAVANAFFAAHEGIVCSRRRTSATWPEAGWVTMAWMVTWGAPPAWAKGCQVPGCRSSRWNPATDSLMWTFTDPGTVEYACHEPGHYEGDMVGTLRIGQG